MHYHIRNVNLHCHFLAIAIGATSFIRKRNKPVPAIETPKPFSNNRFKEEFAIEKEKKLIKERVKTAENDKIERVAAAKVEEEIGEELTPLKNQLQVIQNSLNQLSSGNQQSTISSTGQNQQHSNELLKQLQQFSSQAQQQSKKHSNNCNNPFTKLHKC